MKLNHRQGVIGINSAVRMFLYLGFGLKLIHSSVFVLVLFLCLNVCGTAQSSLPDFEVKVTGHPSPGYMFFAPVNFDSFGIMDHSGRNAYRFANSGTLSMQVQTDGTLLYANAAAQAVYRMNANFQVIDTLRVMGATTFDFHECKMVSPNSYVILGSQKVTVDMSKIVIGGKTNASVIGAVIQEVNLQGQVLFEWRSLHYIPVDQATADIDLTQQTIDYIHVNSIAMDNDGNYLVSCRHLDQVVKINKANGQIMWQMGGSASKKNDFTFTNDGYPGFVGFSHQHDVSRLSNGNIILFDNGNMRAIPYSRVVEYEVNELTRNVKRVWDYRRNPDLYANSMGSVQELPNGHILIGWGSNGSQLVAEEIDKSGTIHAQWISPTDLSYDTYRAKKAVFAMTGVERIVNSKGWQEFKTTDSTTHVSLNVTDFKSSTSVIVERHPYRAHSVSFTTGLTAETIPMRWVVRVQNKKSLTAQTVFNIGSLPGVVSPKNVKLFWRAVEGKGEFSSLPTTYDSVSKTLTASLTQGEILPGYLIAMNPVLISPIKNQVVKAIDVPLLWSNALDVSSYDVMVSSEPSFSTFIHNRNLKDTTTTFPFQYGYVYYWRVRARRGNEIGNWVTGSFINGLLTPVQVSPTQDGTVWNSDVPMVWRSSINATRYRVTIVDYAKDSSVVLDTVVSDTTMRVRRLFSPNTVLNWRVRPERILYLGEYSQDTSFLTGPPPPFLKTPLDDEKDLYPFGVRLVWNQVENVKQFRVQLRRNDTSTVLLDTITQRYEKVLPVLKYSESYAWRCKGVLANGEGEWGEWRVFTTSNRPLEIRPPILIAPIGDVGLVDVPFTWTKQSLASHYRLQVTSSTDFEQLEYDVTTEVDTTFVVPRLSPKTAYLWRVRSENQTDISEWSDTAQAITTRTASVLFPLSPVYGASQVALYVNFSFVTGKEFLEYKVILDSDLNFSSPNETNGIFSPISVGPLAYNTQYYWKVVGTNSQGQLDTGVVSTFKTVRELTSNVEENVGNTLVLATVQGGVLTVRSSSVGIRSIQLHNATGQQLANVSTHFNSTVVEHNLNQNGRGVLFLTVLLENDSVVQFVVPI